MAGKKGFLHVTEAIIVILLVFVIMFQFSTIPRIRSEWDRPKLEVIAYDLLYSLEGLGIDWFDTNATRDDISAELPPSIGFTVATQQEVMPVTRVGCVCDPVNFSILRNEILPDFQLNGHDRDFVFQRIDHDDLKFSLGNDVILFWGYPDHMDDSTAAAARDRDLILRYLETGRGVVEFSDLTESQVVEQWHEDVFGLQWTYSDYDESSLARFPHFAPGRYGYQVQKLFYKLPYMPYDDSALVGYWKFDTGSGGTAYDSSPYSNDGNMVGPTWTSGRFGPALHFAGGDDHVNAGNVVDAMDGDFTWMAWIYLEDASLVTGIIEKGMFPVSGAAFYVEANPGRHLMITDNAPPTVYASDTQLEFDRWYHVAVAYDGTEVTFYLDGQDDGTRSVPPGSLDDIGFDLILGRVWSFPFEGTIDEVMIFNKSLSQTEVQQIYLRSFDPDVDIENFVSEKVYPVNLGNAPERIVLEQSANLYKTGAFDGLSVPVAVIDWNVEGNGRSAWMSGGDLDPAKKQLLRSLIIWASRGRDYTVVPEEELKESTEVSMIKVLNQDMHELVKVSLNLGYYF